MRAICLNRVESRESYEVSQLAYCLIEYSTDWLFLTSSHATSGGDEFRQERAEEGDVDIE